MRSLKHTTISCLALLVAACSPAEDLDVAGQIYPVPFDEEGKDDGPGQAAIRVDADVTDTQVWAVRHMWEERDETPEARAEGLAWSANSHLNWDEKYAAWVQSMPKTPFADNPERVTFEIITPQGKRIGGPSLECAEMAMFLRAVFSAWYGLPFFMEARDGSGGRVFFGHFGTRTPNGRWRNSPAFSKYADHSATWKPGKPWPQDAGLRRLKLGGNAPNASADDQPMIAADARTGAYMDELFLNKRAGYLVLYILDYFYSGSLADTVNTYNLKPEAIRAGDVLIRRWQRNGIGHVFQVKNVTVGGDGRPMAEMIYGGMPRHQGEWSDEVEGKSSLTGDDTGGTGLSGDTPSVPFWKLGGGLKRWRVARNIGGSWTNTYMPEDKGNWINATDGARLGARPKQFERVLGEVPPEQKRDSLLKTIESTRKNLMENPSSCASRTDRDKAMYKLLSLADKLGTTEAQLVKEYRKLEDYVFQPLSYSSSKTCCWNSSSTSMYRVIMDYAADERQKQQMCAEPTVFRAEQEVPAGYKGPVDGYQRWRHWAAQMGRSAEWIDAGGKPAVWSEDEQCEQRGVMEDYVSRQIYQDLCPPQPPPPDSPSGPVDGGTGEANNN